MLEGKLQRVQRLQDTFQWQRAKESQLFKICLKANGHLVKQINLILL
jgi:hypothetical protein